MKFMKAEKGYINIDNVFCFYIDCIPIGPEGCGKFKYTIVAVSPSGKEWPLKSFDSEEKCEKELDSITKDFD